MPRSKSSGGTSQPPWVIKEIQELIDLLIQREITEFEMEKDGFRIRIRRGNNQAVVASSDVASFAHPVSVASIDSSSAAAPTPQGAPASPEPSSAESAEGLYVIKSPIVGTFYAAPAPNAPPFVKVGDVVQVGQVLCIIEAMKLMNEIEAEIAGEIARTYIENGQPVEYGQSLFAIRPHHKK